MSDCLSVCSVGVLTVTHQGAACDAGPTYISAWHKGGLTNLLIGGTFDSYVKVKDRRRLAFYERVACASTLRVVWERNDTNGEEQEGFAQKESAESYGLGLKTGYNAKLLRTYELQVKLRVKRFVLLVLNKQNTFSYDANISLIYVTNFNLNNRNLYCNSSENCAWKNTPWVHFSNGRVVGYGLAGFAVTMRCLRFLVIIIIIIIIIRSPVLPTRSYVLRIFLFFIC